MKTPPRRSRNSAAASPAASVSESPADPRNNRGEGGNGRGDVFNVKQQLRRFLKTNSKTKKAMTPAARRARVQELKKKIADLHRENVPFAD